MRIWSSILALAIMSFALICKAQTAAAPRVASPPVEQSAKKTTSESKVMPVKINGNVAILSPENTKVDFVGTHTGDQPNPRLGGFEKFTGKIQLDKEGQPSSVAVEFDVNSLWTQIPNLTRHLKTADFLDAEKFPTAKFNSTSIEPGRKEGWLKITGDFQLHGKSQEISFPAKIRFKDGGLVLASEFKIDRTQFGIDKMVNRVTKEVAIMVSVGEKTAVDRSDGGGPGQVQRGVRATRGNVDPDDMLKRFDKNGDGKLSGEELPQFLSQRLETIDADGDKAVSLDELKTMMRQFRSGGSASDGGK